MILKNDKLLILNLLFFLLPISFIIGAAIVEIVFIFLSILICLKYKKEIFDPNFRNIIIFFLLFYFYINLNSFFAINKPQAFKSSIPYIRYLLVILALSFFLKKNEFLLKKKLTIYYFLIVILFLDSSLQYFLGKNILGLRIIDPNSMRVSSFFGTELILGGYISKIFPLIISLIFFLQDYYKKKITYELLLVCIFVLLIAVYAGERVALFHLILSLIYLLFFLNQNYKTKKIFLIFLIILSSFFFLTENVIKKRLVNHTLLSFIDRDNNANLNSKILIYSQMHHSHILSAYKMFLDSPIIGNGLKSFRNLCENENYKVNDFSCTTHPHNTIILFLSELGIIGLLFYLISFFYFIKNFLFFFNKTQMLYVKSIQCITIGILIIYYLPVPSGAFFNNFFSYQFYFLISFHLLFLKFYQNNKLKQKV
tara:strand:+ start:6500 stop:7774 length:1275 start_codon:yes stop_codon:yes gene_type:complete